MSGHVRVGESATSDGGHDFLESSEVVQLALVEREHALIESPRVCQVCHPRADGLQRSVVRRDLTSFNEGLRSCIAEMETWTDGPWLVAVISTPSTIWRDIQGSRRVEPTEHKHFTHTQLPEPNILGAIGRGELWIHA